MVLTVPVSLQAGGIPEDQSRAFRESVLQAVPTLEVGRLPEFLSGLPQEPALAAYWKKSSPKDIAAVSQWALAKLDGAPVPLGLTILKPEAGADKKAVVLFFHGYASHNGFYLPFFHFLSKAGYWVVAADLPGHGLSGGRVRGDVGDFSDYGKMVETVKAWVDSIPEWTGLRRIGMGHSTGGLSLFEYVSHHNGGFDKLVLGAPLVKPVGYGPATFGNLVFGWIGSFGVDTGGDPLRPPYFPMHWVQALADWNGRIEKYPVQTSLPVLFIYGTADAVVETPQNVDFLKTKFPLHEVFSLPGMSHVVYQEDAFRQKVWNRVLEFVQ